jgi:hypothetical protein
MEFIKTFSIIIRLTLHLKKKKSAEIIKQLIFMF